MIKYGALVGQSRAAAEAAKSKGWEVAVVDPHWVYPVSEELVQLAGAADLVVTVEDNGIHGGAGSALQAALSAAEVDTPVRLLAVPQEYLAHASRGEVLEEIGLDVATVERRVTGWLDRV